MPSSTKPSQVDGRFPHLNVAYPFVPRESEVRPFTDLSNRFSANHFQPSSLPHGSEEYQKPFGFRVLECCNGGRPSRYRYLHVETGRWRTHSDKCVRFLVHYDDSLSFITYYPLFSLLFFCISSFSTISHASDTCLLTSSEVCAIHSAVAHNSPIISIYSNR